MQPDIQIETVETETFYKVDRHQICPSFYGPVEAVIDEENPGEFYCIVIDDEDQREKTFTTKNEAQKWVNKELQRLIRYYDSFNTRTA